MDNVLNYARPLLAITPLRWTQMCQTLPVELLNRQPAPGQWSAVECLIHMLDTETLFARRVGYFQEGRDFPAFNPDEEGTRLDPSTSPAELAAEFARRREKSLAILAQLTREDLDLRARHQELGPVTLGEMVHEWAAHDLNHTVQAERALMQPFLHGCGPWLTYFTDHLAGPFARADG